VTAAGQGEDKDRAGDSGEDEDKDRGENVGLQNIYSSKIVMVAKAERGQV
jgi:hypothetical protein